MLSSDTKRRIDSCRDILVGQLPLPTDQVELITLALIYKFMDDLDEQSVQLGGKRSFFIKDLADFRWRSLMPQTVSAADRVRLFADGLEALGDPKTGKHLPEMFRDIFRNAMLKFRDGRILSLFLTELDGFAYSHSEELGNAFEYLLQSMGAQGDNGQFRTPRHIIDFIVEVLEPKPEDKILDPACGTGGFLVSAYKHILGKHTSKGSSVPGDQLSPAKKEKLTQQLNGYDITPMMVKLSKVNMFLHGFSDPQIHEYDTLSNDARWNEKYDLIMANPPFMTPKGGVVPHTKFRIAAKKAEVLFTDYIAEHLTTNGRAGIIVPEGIIFQSGTVYKALRKFLVEDSLVAVISLPAGVFNPYSGVKTSILILDKRLARQSDSIAFFKVENDGYDLGAQRRPIDKNDLPRLTQEIHDYLEKLRSGKKMSDRDGLHIAPKEKIAANGEFNLGGERYREVATASNLKWPLLPLGELCVIERGASPRPIHDFITTESDGVNWIKIGDAEVGAKYITTTKERVTPEGAAKSRRVKRGDFILSNSMSFGRPYIMATDGCIHDGWLLLRDQSDRLDQDFLYNILGSDFVVAQFKRAATGGVVNNLNSEIVRGVKIPLPPLDTQKEIVAEIEGYQKVIDGARAVVENYKPQIPIDPEWPVVELGSQLVFVSSGATPKGGRETYVDKGVLFIRSQNILYGSCDFSDAAFITDETHNEMSRSQVKHGDVFLNITGASIGRSAWMDKDIPANVNQHVAILRVGPRLNNIFLSVFLNSSRGQDQITSFQAGGTREALNYTQIKELKIPLPNLEEQKQICSEIEKEQAMVNANKELIARFENKIQAVMDKVWGSGTA
jgi:type I restriction enzyme M protein